MATSKRGNRNAVPAKAPEPEDVTIKLGRGNQVHAKARPGDTAATYAIPRRPCGGGPARRRRRSGACQGSSAGLFDG